MKTPYLIATLTVIGLAALAGAQAQDAGRSRPAKPAERQAAVASIQAQLKAFGKDDYKTAVTYQSQGLRKNFSSTEAFRAMMVRAYPEFAHFKSVTFGPAQSDPTGTHLAIPATVTGRDGVTVRCVYLMVREGKAYHVEGVAGGAQAPPDSAPEVPGKDV